MVAVAVSPRSGSLGRAKSLPCFLIVHKEIPRLPAPVRWLLMYGHKDPWLTHFIEF
jgi:hypothetical protein